MDQLQSKYYVIPGSIGPPEIYLGAEIKIKRTNDRCGKPAWSSSSNKYITESIEVVTNRMHALNLAFIKTAKNPLNPVSNIKYRPEMDMSAYCTAQEHQFYQKCVGILRLMIELGRIDICTEVSLVSRYLT